MLSVEMLKQGEHVMTVCNSCRYCEAYCPVDALFVSPDAHRHVDVSEEQLAANGTLGSYRRALGWSNGGDPSGWRMTLPRGIFV